METRKGYLIVIRHGARRDEVERFVQDADPELTPRAIEDGLDTGVELMKYMHKNGMLGEETKGFKFITSVMYRCLQTMQQVRKGMELYSHDNANELPFDWGKYISQKSTFVEEACTEKTEAKEIEPGFFEEVRYLADHVKLFDEMNEINPKARQLFDYNGRDSKLAIKAWVKDSKVKKKLCESFFANIVEQMRADPQDDKYIIVAHNQNLNKLASYFGGKAHASVQYNSCSIVEVNLDSTQRPPPVKVMIENKRLTNREGEHVDKTTICKFK